MLGVEDGGVAPDNPQGLQSSFARLSNVRSKVCEVVEVATGQTLP